MPEVRSGMSLSGEIVKLKSYHFSPSFPLAEERAERAKRCSGELTERVNYRQCIRKLNVTPPGSLVFPLVCTPEQILEP